MSTTMTPPAMSGSDLVSMAPADLFSGISDAPAADSGSPEGESSAPEEIETPAPDSTDDAGEPADAPEPELGDEIDSADPAAPSPAAKTAEVLPEGVVRGKNSQGKPGLFVEESRWQNIYGNHQLVQKASEMLGEPFTPEALQARENAFMATERLLGDVVSADPQAQSNVVGWLFDEMERAREAGEIADDATVPFAQSFYNTVRDKSPDAYANLRLAAARDFIGEMFQEAAAAGNENLWLSTQHIVRALANVDKGVTDPGQIRAIAERMGIPFYTKAEMSGLSRGADPLAALRTENERLRAQVSGGSGQNRAAQFDQWFGSTSKTVNTAIVDEAVRPALSAVEQAWKKFPDDYSRLVVDPLHREVSKVIRDDQVFQQKVNMLHQQAKRTASAQRRDEIGQQIRQAYVNRAKLAADAVKGPILKFAATSLKQQSTQNHERRQQAQDRTVPRGASGAVQRPLVPAARPAGEVFDPKKEVQRLAALFR